MSTRGSMAATRLRRSTGDGGSAIMLSLVGWILPASSTCTSALAASRPPTCQSAKPWKASFRLVTWVICSRSRGSGRERGSGGEVH